MNTANDIYTSIDVLMCFLATTDDECSHPRGSCLPTSVIFVTLSNYTKWTQPTNILRSDVRMIRDMNKYNLSFGGTREVNYD